jgi:hypothetical protein
MDTNERIKWLLEATPEQLAAYDALRSGQKKANAPSLRLYRMGEAAKATGRSRCSLWRAAKSGTLKTVAFREGGVRMIPEEELRKLVGV